MDVRISNSFNLGGKAFPRSRTISGEGILMREKDDMPAAKVGALTTRTDNDTGVLTMVTGHGIITADKVDVFWANPDGTRGCRYNMDATVAGDAVSIDGGAGDNLPADETDVTAMVPLSEAFAIVGNDIKAYAVWSEAIGVIKFFSSAPALLAAVVLDATNQSFTWDEKNKYANPLAGVTVATVKFSHADSTKARDARVGAVFTN